MSNGWDADDLSRRLRSALRRPAVTPGARDEAVRLIMARVRVETPPGIVRRRSPRTRLGARGAGVRRLPRAWLGTLAAAAVLAGAAVGIGSVHALWRASMPRPLEASATLIGDSIVSTFHDTLDLVRVALRVQGASRVVIAGDFNGWSGSATPLVHDANDDPDRWSAVIALRRGQSHYAFLVDDTRWVSAPRAPVAPRAATPPVLRPTHDSL